MVLVLLAVGGSGVGVVGGRGVGVVGNSGAAVVALTITQNKHITTKINKA